MELGAPHPEKGGAGVACSLAEGPGGVNRAGMTRTYGTLMPAITMYDHRPMARVVDVRRLTVEDATALIGLRREALETDPLSFAASIEDDRGLSPDFVRASLADVDEGAVFGCFDRADLAGMVGVARQSRLKQRHAGIIWGMYVTPRLRGRGAGRALLEAAVSQARSWRLEQVELGVTEYAAAARRMYEAAGFRAWGHQPRALQWQGRFVDEDHMVLDLREQGG